MTTINLSPRMCSLMAEAMQLRVQACEAYGGKCILFSPRKLLRWRRCAICWPLPISAAALWKWKRGRRTSPWPRFG